MIDVAEEMYERGLRIFEFNKTFDEELFDIGA